MTSKVQLKYIIVFLITCTITILLIKFWYDVVSVLNDCLPYNIEANDLLNHQSYKKVIFITYSFLLTGIVFFYIKQKNIVLIIKILFIVLYTFWILYMLMHLFAIGLIH
jgi:hypothetical protein